MLKRYRWEFLALVVLLVVTIGANGGCGGCAGPVGDTVKPQVAVTITSGATNNVITGDTVGIKVEASDNVALAKIELYIDGIKKAEGTSSPLTYNWDVNGLAYGTTHTILARAYDNSGNVGESVAVVLTVGDVNAPSITITSPGDWVKTNFTLKATINERSLNKAPSCLKKIEVYINDELQEDVPIDPSLNLTSYTLSMTVDLPSGLDEGDAFTITIKAYDYKDNVGTATKTVRKDTVSPTVVVMKPIYNIEVNDGDVVQVEAIANDATSGIDKVEFYASTNSYLDDDDLLIGTGTYDPASNSWKLDWNTANTPANATGESYYVIAKAYDKASNTANASSAGTVRIKDTLAPTNITISAQNVDGWIGALAKFTVTAQDRAPSGLKEAQLQYLVGNSWTNIGSPANFVNSSATINVDLSSLSSGQTYKFRAVVRDKAGNSANSGEVSYKLDKIAPTVSSIVSSEGTILNGVTTITASASDDANGIGLDRVRIKIIRNSDNVVVLDNVDTVASYQWTWDTTNLAEGVYTIKVTAYDKVGNESQEITLTATVDKTAPTVIVTASATNVVSGTTVTLTATANESLSKVEFYVNDTLIGTDTNEAGGWTTVWNTTGHVGTFSIKAKGYDKARPIANVGVSSATTVTVQQPQ